MYYAKYNTESNKNDIFFSEKSIQEAFKGLLKLLKKRNWNGKIVSTKLEIGECHDNQHPDHVC